MHNTINNFIKHNFFRTFLTLCFGVFIGYTLQPIPQIFQDLIQYHLTKYFILVILGILTFYPINNEKLVEILIGSFLVLVMFELMRKL